MKLDDAELIHELEKRGYIVRHKSEAFRALSWNRTAPFPDGVDFKAEAVEEIRKQIVQEMIRYDARTGTDFGPEIHSATLRVM